MNWEKGFDKFETSNQLTSAGQQIEMAYQNAKRTLKKRIKNEVWLSNYKYTNMGKLFLKTQCSFTPFPSIQYYRVHKTWSTLRKQTSRCINVVDLKNELRFSEARRCSKTVSWKIRKAAGCSFIKQGFWHRYFLVNFPKFFKTATIQKIRETLLHFFRSSHPEVFLENACTEAFFNEVADLRPATLLKEKL